MGEIEAVVIDSMTLMDRMPLVSVVTDAMGWL